MTTVTLGSRLFFILLQINLNLTFETRLQLNPKKKHGRTQLAVRADASQCAGVVEMMTLLCHDVLAMCLLLVARLRAVMALLSHPSQRVAVSQREVQRAVCKTT